MSSDAIPETKQPAWAARFFGLWPGSKWLVFESTKTPEQLKADLRAGLAPVWDIVTPGFKGWVLGPFVRIGWLPGWYGFWERSHLAFRGMVEATPTGSRMTGYVRMHALLELYVGWIYFFMAVAPHITPGWSHTGLKYLIALAMVSAVTWLVRIGAKTAVMKIHHHLARVCATVPAQDTPKEPWLLAPG